MLIAHCVRMSIPSCDNTDVDKFCTQSQSKIVFD